MNIDKIRSAFTERFGGHGLVYTSPGRINLIGEHTDYNGGFVFPGAIDKAVVAEIRPNKMNIVRLYALDLDTDNRAGFAIEDDAFIPPQQWARYIFGVCREILKRGGNPCWGFDAVFSGDVPLGAGMSSSAALESTFAFAMNDFFEIGIDKFELAKIGQATEHNYCGVKCGIMDQFASIFGKAGNLILLDCRSLEYKYFPFNPTGYKLVLLNTRVKHELADGEYNKRRASCERAAAAIRANHPEVEFLRDATAGMLEEVKAGLAPEDYLRAQYVIEEVQRVMDVCQALEQGDYETVGERMYGTHHGMSKLYEVSCPELDFLNDIARQCGVTGSRVMGGGFGGCTINLVKEEKYDDFIQEAFSAFRIKFGREPLLYDVVISDGARRLY